MCIENSKRCIPRSPTWTAKSIQRSRHVTGQPSSSAAAPAPQKIRDPIGDSAGDRQVDSQSSRGVATGVVIVTRAG
jgi:hypothetical protein